MFSYYGSKSKIVHLYPKPKFDKIIEPFAGSARYSLRYFDRDVLLVDKYDVIVDLWKWLQQASTKDITSLPTFNQGDVIKREQFDCDGQFYFVSLCISAGVGQPRYTVTEFGADSYGQCIKRALRYVGKIKHWKFICGDYSDIENQDATWFIDPPYQVGGEHQYKYNSKILEFDKLADWCKSRMGQIIVCENTKADWLPFYPMRFLRGVNATNTTEAIWSNMPHNFQARQPELM